MEQVIPSHCYSVVLQLTLPLGGVRTWHCLPYPYTEVVVSHWIQAIVSEAEVLVLPHMW